MTQVPGNRMPKMQKFRADIHLLRFPLPAQFLLENCTNSTNAAVYNPGEF